MRFLFIVSVFALSGCLPDPSSFTINGKDVTRAQYEEYIKSQTGTKAPPQNVSMPLDGLADLDPAFRDVADQMQTLAAASIDTRSNASFSAVPTLGEGKFKGVITAATSGSPSLSYTARAETTLTVDFVNNTLTAENGQFILRDGSNLPVETLNGDLAIMDGTIRGSRKNSVEMAVNGTLAGENNYMFVSGNLSGSFKGTPILGLQARTDDATGIVNGVGAISTTITIEALAMD